ncbi:MAG: hypothetical protein HC860_10565 [Alkalinema sp. RU_4_3]|nr:hypothetical protein [Alkalinema sp. RU_4_3]
MARSSLVSVGLLGLSLSLTSGLTPPIASAQVAQPVKPSAAPAKNPKPNPQTNPQFQDVQERLSRIDAAANSKDIQALMSFYSQEFTNSDGLTRQSLQKAIAQLWQEYPALTYRTELLEILPSRSKGIEIETITYATAKTEIQGRPTDLSFMVKSRQRWEEDKLIQQTVLSEQNRVSFGDQPPTILVRLPDSVKVGQKYTYEAIMQEPIAPDDYILGDILEETISPATHLSTAKIQFEVPSIAEILNDRIAEPATSSPPSATLRRFRLRKLRTGGFFKIAQAPKRADDQWLSVVLVRPSGGMTLISQRLQVTN